MPRIVREGRSGPEVTAPRNCALAGSDTFETDAGLHAAAAVKQSNRLLEDQEIAAPAREDDNP